MWYATSYQFSMCLVRYLWLSMKVILYRRHGVWNYWNTDCLFNSTAWESNKLSPLLAPCEGNPPDTDWVPSQRHINSFPPSAAYMPQWTGSAVVQIMACRLSGAEPLHEAMLTYCQLDPWEQNLVKFESKFHSRKCIWNVFCEMEAILSRGRWVNTENISMSWFHHGVWSEVFGWDN